MALPALRQPVVLDGYRGSGVGDPSKNYRLLVDLQRLEPKPGQYVFLSPSSDYRVLLRGAKTLKTRGGQITGEIDPLEVKFESGFFITDDEETGELMMKNPQRGRQFFDYASVVEMQDEANEKKIEEVLSAVSDKGLARLKQRLDAKGFNLGKKAKS